MMNSYIRDNTDAIMDPTPTEYDKRLIIEQQDAGYEDLWGDEPFFMSANNSSTVSSN